GSRVAPLRYESAARIKFLNSGVDRVGNIDVIRRVNCNPAGKVELTVTGAAAAPIEKWRASRVEFVNTLPVSVQDIDVICRVDGNTAGSYVWTTNKTLVRAG